MIRHVLSGWSGTWSASSHKSLAAGALPAGAGSTGQNGFCAQWRRAEDRQETWRSWSFRLSLMLLDTHFVRSRREPWSRCRVPSSISTRTLSSISASTVAPGDSMATIHIEDRAHQADPKQNLLHACLSLGLNLPYFCWHPAMGSVGACRQCAVKEFRDEKDTHGRLVMACMTPAAPNTRISIDDADAREFRLYVGEWLMVHHPHDCPVCDEGGECHLQDMTVMDGHNYRRYRGEKRTFRNQDLGPFVNQEMNRCIQCYRCVRFYRDYAGGRDFDAHFLRDRVFFGRHEDGVLESEFSGNLVEVCPTGVFTDKTLKQHYTRKWDLTMAPSICQHCSLGCNIIAGERYGDLRMIANRYHGEVNGYFICDRGRFGYEFVNAPDRVREPVLNGKVITRDEVLEEIKKSLKEAKVIGIGSPRASIQSNFALKALVGKNNFYHGVSENEHDMAELAIKILKEGP